MSIEVVCANGHTLKVKDSLAGKTGLCPVCKVRVRVPDPTKGLSEDEILTILASESAESEGLREYHNPDGAAEVAPTPPKKICPKCQREILAATHICPYCRTYIAGISDFLTK